VPSAYSLWQRCGFVRQGVELELGFAKSRMKRRRWAIEPGASATRSKFPNKRSAFIALAP
jgi:hypothetical protein